jgi:Dyp-type peroxidase family
VTHALITLAIPFEGKHAARVNGALDALGNPARGEIAERLRAARFVHFMSITVIGEDPARKSYLVLEASADGSASSALRAMADTIGDFLRGILQAAGIDVDAGALARYLELNRLDVGVGWSQSAGVLFSGTPGMSVPRILKERDLAARIEGWLGSHPATPGEPALCILERVRAEVFKDVELKECFVADPVPWLGVRRTLLDALLPLLISLLRFLLWPLFALAAFGGLASWLALGRSFGDAVRDGLAVLGAEALCVPFVLWLVYWRLRRLEARDTPDDRNPHALEVAALMERENHARQNHLAAVSVIKPGLLRRVILRFVLWAVQAQATYVAQPGLLSGIGSIHFARWVQLDRDRLLFFSNYGGSWSSYLEDFIARAAAGLTAIWSNTRGFPRAHGLLGGGASDGERFKRWARRQQIPTRFWYTAYPSLTTSRIRLNAAIRHGFAGASTEAAAADWLRLTGFAGPAAQTVTTEEVPTLVFGGLKPLNYSHCLVVQLAEGPGCRGWLRKVAPDLRYGERRPEGRALVAGLSASGLLKVVGEPHVLDGFPSAFVHGMAAPWRSRTLGDTGASSPQKWWWGRPGVDTDVLLAIYADSPEDLRNEVERQRGLLAASDHAVLHEVVLDRLPERDEGPIREPFGFIDGTSQPIMRGTARWRTQRNSIHVIEPGELVLGYPDDLGYVAPTPHYNGRDIGRDGTYLVVRQLEQNVAAFDSYLDAVARQVDPADPRVPEEARAELREWIAAKMVGRWREDGSSLVRHPAPPRQRGRAAAAEADNDFLFGTEDPHGARCPFGSHIRRANPRDSFEPGSSVQIRITNRHRIFRVGRRYSAQNGSDHPGLLFMCVNADIEDQFEFLQQTWVMGRSFHAMADEVDPVVAGPMAADATAITIPTARGPLRVNGLQGLDPFVTVRGGGYFFMPGRSTLERLLS